MAATEDDRTALHISAADGSRIQGATQVAGDLFQTFINAPGPLRSHIRVQEFQSLVTERMQTFVGREYVLGAVDALLSSNTFPSGYILLRGEPGIGKTAIMCALVSKAGYLHHFNIAPQNIRSNRAFLENICAQLIVRYGLDYTSLPPSASENSAFLSQLLAEVAATHDHPIVLLVDAIDEAEKTKDDANQLFLPPTLPRGIFFIVSSREQLDYRLFVDRQEDIYIRDDDPANLADVRLFINRFLENNQEKMRAALERWSSSSRTFTEDLMERSQGNFMYLVHVLNDILEGRISPANIENIRALPRGLQAYYRRHWRVMKNLEPERFELLFEPVLRLLATVREPVPLSYIQDLTGLESWKIQEVVVAWRQFLNETEGTDGPLFRVYHLSFQDFLAEEGMGLKPFHERIAMRALAKIPGFFDHLP